ncbi:NAD-dependent epimerase/dehydratase family protein [Sulfuricaulis sp.]|jgi:nucleoside-diphosphate-sugar epimerase/GT2 family glycosyltransferase|uniref:NAD-dependent epimerase/dehydratase family protein n=1 Tax=Sulfuricaulis sp. TaxID=2003553 RepID=UPI00355A2A55
MRAVKRWRQQEAELVGRRPQPLPFFSVTIVNFNGGSLLTESVRSVLASSVAVELLVADNGSTDGSLELLRRSVGSDARLHIIENHRNLGFAHACNLLLTQARGDYLLVLNPDALIQPDTLERMAKALQTRPDAGMAGCLIRNPDGSEQAGCRRAVPTPWRSLVRVLYLHRLFPHHPYFRGFVLTRKPLPSSPVPVEAISGAFMLVRREALEQVGPLDEGYFMHCEDLDWCMRFRQAGWQILFVPDVEVVHYKGTCSQGRPIFVEWHKHKGMVRFYRKFFRHQYPLPLMALVAVAVWTRFGLHVARALIQRMLPEVVRVETETTLAAKLAAASYRPVQLHTHPPVRPVDAVIPVTAGTAHSDCATATSYGLSSPLPKISSHASGETDRPAVLVTGATGFIGRRLVEALRERNKVVHALVRHGSRARRTTWSANTVIERHGDLDRPQTLDGMCAGVDTVFHLAGYSGPESDGATEDGHWQVTVEGTRVLLAQASKAGVRRFVFVSSVKAMGEVGEFCLDESSPTAPVSSYGRAKLEAERLVLEAGKQHGMLVCNLRLPLVYGRDNRGNIWRMIAAIDRGRFPPLPETGNRRSMLHVDDVIQALRLAAENSAAHGQTYIVTDDQVYSTYQIYVAVCKALGRPVPRWTIPIGLLRTMAKIGDVIGKIRGGSFVFDSGVLDKLTGSACYSCEKIKMELGYRPTRSLEDGLREMVDEYKRTERP